MNGSKRVAALWISYREAVIPRNASSVQLQECRRAFYGGAHALLNNILVVLTPESEPTEADLRMMTALQDELDNFKREVLEGRA